MRARAIAIVIALLIAVLTSMNASCLAPRPESGPSLLAHRGLGQSFDRLGVTGSTCTASRMLPAEHPFLENTIESTRAAFDLGADIVEIDIHPTVDGEFAVFHDWTLDCRTDGSGVTRERTMEYLRTLDVGWGYTADDGKTFPFRGHGIGGIVSLSEMLHAFPGERFLLNVKSNDYEEGRLLASYLSSRHGDDLQRLAVYGGEQPMMALRSRIGGLTVMSMAQLKRCLVSYIATGWTGYVPETCRETIVVVPSNAAPWLWGWPDRFLARMKAAGSEVFVAGPYEKGRAPGGIDSAVEVKRLSAGYRGGIWTDRIDLVAPAVGRGGGSGGNQSGSTGVP